MGVPPRAGWFRMDNPIKMDDLGVYTPISGNLQLCIYALHHSYSLVHASFTTLQNSIDTTMFGTPRHAEKHTVGPQGVVSCQVQA